MRESGLLLAILVGFLGGMAFTLIGVCMIQFILEQTTSFPVAAIEYLL